jgi:hypothetical protein
LPGFRKKNWKLIDLECGQFLQAGLLPCQLQLLGRLLFPELLQMILDESANYVIFEKQTDCV